MESINRKELLMRNPTRSEMTHQTAYVTVVQCGTEGLGQRIRRVDNARVMAEDNVFLRFPFLHGKVLDVNMTQTGGVGRLAFTMRMGIAAALSSYRVVGSG